MTLFGRYLLLAGLILFALPTRAQELRLLAWNVYMLPPPIKLSKQKERTRLQLKLLREQVEHNDVLVLTEAFQSRYKKKLLKELGEFYPHHIIQKRKGGLFQLKFMSSGVVILSKYPLRQLGQVYYKECAIADCLASKGAMLVELTLDNGNRVQILGTHMQSGKSEKILRARSAQVQQVRALLDEFREAGVPQIVAGDLNMDSNIEPEFELMRRELGLEPLAQSMQYANTIAETVDCFGKKYKGNHENLDHILLRPNQAEVSLSNEVVWPFKGIFSSKQECDLSDHHPVHSVLVFNSRTPSSLAKTFLTKHLMPDFPRAL